MARMLAVVLLALTSFVGHAAARGFVGGSHMGFAPHPGFGFGRSGFFARPGLVRPGFFGHPGFVQPGFFRPGFFHPGFPGFFRPGFARNRFVFGGFFVAPGVPVVPYPAYPFYYPPPPPYTFYVAPP